MKWDDKNIGDVAEIYSGYAFKSVDMISNEEPNSYPVIKIKNVNDRTVSKECDSYLPESSYKSNYSKYTLLAGDILVAMTGQGSVGRIGKMREIDQTYLVNQRVGIVRVDSNLANSEFIYQQISNNKAEKYYYDLAFGAGQPNLSPTDIGSLKIKCPPLLTQRKITSILSAYDDLIENNLKRIKLLEEKAFAVYKLLDKVKKHILAELYDTSSGGTPSRTNAEYFKGEINWFKSKELADSILLESEEKITEGAIDKSSAKLFPTGSVIMAMYGATIGKLGLLSMPSTTNQACCAIIEKDELKSNYYILNWLLENKEYVMSYRMGAAQENISQQVIKNLFISIPKDSDLKIFNSEMKPIYQLIKNLHQQNTKLRSARDLLLTRLMSGEIEV